MKSWEQVVLDKLTDNLPKQEIKKPENLELKKLNEINETIKNLKPVEVSNEQNKD